MTQRYAIDTSILVRLVAGLPQDQFESTVDALQILVQEEGMSLLATEMVIGEAYSALQHHYGLSKADVRKGLHDALTSGLVAPARGQAVLDVIKAAAKGCGLLDRLILHDAQMQQMNVQTLDRKMARLAGAQLVKSA